MSELQRLNLLEQFLDTLAKRAMEAILAKRTRESTNSLQFLNEEKVSLVGRNFELMFEAAHAEYLEMESLLRETRNEIIEFAYIDLRRMTDWHIDTNIPDCIKPDCIKCGALLSYWIMKLQPFTVSVRSIFVFRSSKKSHKCFCGKHFSLVLSRPIYKPLARSHEGEGKAVATALTTKRFPLFCAARSESVPKPPKTKKASGTILPNKLKLPKIFHATPISMSIINPERTSR
jgi:hypothetical protein